MTAAERWKIPLPPGCDSFNSPYVASLLLALLVLILYASQLQTVMHDVPAIARLDYTPTCRDPVTMATYTAEISISRRNASCIKQLPKCIIAGVMKSGTQALATFLALHPDVALKLYPPTVLFFNQNYYKGLRWYRKQMACSMPGQITMEKSPQYFRNPRIPERILEMDKDMKILIIVRDPVRRSVSHYTHVKFLQTRPFMDPIVELLTNQKKASILCCRTCCYAQQTNSC